MSEPTCPQCARPIHDTAYICTACAGALQDALGDVVKVAGDITLTVARLDRVQRHGGTPVEMGDDGWHRGKGALFPTPLIVNLSAARSHDAAAGELTTWARHVVEERGARPGPGHPLAACALFLAGQVDWLRHQPEAGEAFTALTAACRTIVSIVDRPADRTVVGRCPCGTYLYARQGADNVACTGCGTSYDVASSRDDLRRELEDRLMTAGQIATMAAHLGLTNSRETTRKLINKWAERSRIVAHGRIDGDPTYLFGEVLTRLLAVAA